MNDKTVENIKKLPTNYSTYAAMALAVLGYLGSTGAQSFEDLTTNFSWPKAITFATGLLTFFVTRVIPQTPPPADDL